MRSPRLVTGLIAAAVVLALLPVTARASDPVINTTMTVAQTGSEPFDDATWDGASSAGLDSSGANNVVRLQDSITYRIEASVNGAAVDAVVAVVTAGPAQQWILVPDECTADPSVASGIYDSSSNPVAGVLVPDGDRRVLVCNFGATSPGTDRVVMPAARVMAMDSAGNAVRNGDRTAATVQTYGYQGGSATTPITAAPADVEITAAFEVNLTQASSVSATDPAGNPQYVPDKAFNAAGTVDGYLMSYDLTATYQRGSMIADSGTDNYLADYQLLAFYTDASTANNGVKSSSALLYTWGTEPACSILGDSGASAAVTCTQNVVTGDFLGPAAPHATPDGVADANVTVALDDIDTRDPDGDATLFRVRLTWWVPVTDVTTSCTSGSCTLETLAGAGVYRAGTIVGFNPVSTEDATGTNLPNYAGAGEPVNDTWTVYPLASNAPGSHVAQIEINHTYEQAGAYYKGNAVEQYAPGSTFTVGMLVSSRSPADGEQWTACTKVDTSRYHFSRVSDPLTFPPTGSFFYRAPYNPAVFAGADAYWTTGDAHSMPDHLTLRYSNVVAINDPVAAKAATCDDDINHDGDVVVVPAGGSATNADWYSDPADVPGGADTITMVRMDYDVDVAAVNAIAPGGSNDVRVGVVLDMQVRSDITSAWGPNNYLDSFLTARYPHATSPWRGHDATASAASTDPSSIDFSFDQHWADRAALAASSQSILKQTVPAGTTMVKSGDELTFQLTASLFGQWSPDLSTVDVADVLPKQTALVLGSERFSVDDGVTWLTYADYLATARPVTMSLNGSDVTPSGHGSTSRTLGYHFTGVQSGENPPLIRYTVRVAEASGTLINEVTMTSLMAGDMDGDGVPDPSVQQYRISVDAGAGSTLLTTTGDEVTEVSSPVVFDLRYQNLGSQDHSAGDFIDVLPFNGDGLVSPGGTVSLRTPGSRFTGSYRVTKLTGTNSEVFYATNAEPSTVSVDPCHSANVPSGYVPRAGDPCFRSYSTNGNTLPDGRATGAGTVTWTRCSATDPVTCGSLDPAAITAIRFTTGPMAATQAHSVQIELTPRGNKGGVPVMGGDGRVSASSTGDLYTNTFGGRIPEAALLVVSHEVTTTVIAGSIGDRVWLDANGDGVQDPGEAGVSGVRVTLSSADPASPGTFVPYRVPDPSDPTRSVDATTTTGADGSYLFANLPSGNYQVQVVPTGPIASDGPTYDATGAFDNRSTTSLYGPDHPNISMGFVSESYRQVTSATDQDFGYSPTPGSVGKAVWFDVNGDGKRDADEPPLPGVTVIVTDSGPDGVLETSDDVSVTTTTDLDGSYRVTGLALRSYRVAVDTATLPGGLAATFDADGQADSTSLVTLDSAAPANPNQDFGFTGTGTLGDTVWLDSDSDGVQDAAEPGLAGIPVTVEWSGPDGDLTTTADNLTYSTATNASGVYLVTGLPMGTFAVSVNTDAIPSLIASRDFDGGGDSVSVTELSVGAPTDSRQDFGFVGPGRTGDTVWLDTDGDGVQDPTEVPLAGVTLTATWVGPDRVAGNGDDLRFSATTDDDGHYLIPGLPLGAYTVAVDTSTLPGGLTATFDADGAGSAHTSALTVTDSDTDALDQRFGYRGAGAIGQTVWFDANRNGVQDATEAGLAGVSIVATWAGPDEVLGTEDDLGFVTATDAAGRYRVTGLPLGGYLVEVVNTSLPFGLTASFDADDGGNSASKVTLTAAARENRDQNFGYVGTGQVGDTIWLDRDGDGRQGDGESGLAGVVVRLTWAGPDAAFGTADDEVRSTVTGSEGRYLMSGLPLGRYQVKVDPTSLPDGVEPSFDADGGADHSSVFTLTPQRLTNPDQDFGYRGVGSIGGTVWADADSDGVRSAGEAGIGSLFVHITWAGPDQILGTEDDLVYTTVTDSQGDYAVDGLAFGEYRVSVDLGDNPRRLTISHDPDGGYDGVTQVQVGDDDPQQSVGALGLTPQEQGELPDTGE